MSYNLPLAIPSLSVGSLENYISSVKSFPMLTHEEELDLATRFQRDNDLDAARDLVLSHLRVVVSVARGYAGYGLPQADLIQEGNIGLMKAVKRYDPSRGVRLVSFALHWIRAEMHEYVLRNWRLVKIATTKAQRKLFFNLRSLKQGLESMKPQEVKKIALELNVSESDVVEMEARFNGREMALEADMDDEDDKFSPIAYLAADTENEPSNTLERTEREHLKTVGLSRALDSLDDRSRRIIEARWLQENEDVATLHDLAAEFDVSAERIRQIEKKALSKMQASMMAQA
ncbi:MAG: RNA polymerase factor sigma-32 [Gallionellales bacterium 35-53-114]|nr:MAG: RNA polymerase factor sigma-32 [Gallionellales bacterium 35-53-114]OYZ64179.1 MAG: RNA polymerase factor sigma-32 [Gallionellales bacterium 24-53-125]OZB10512.1 MAG: RNA polymerase factor sigma-32 [Gallionellales bacterium 39-52-133]HQS57132.1 RNA polymerase sigma factor RpoH [Gallionellaceae bacterium]HQS74680.1 RNA polymerase sigma factor RpoH [Gallionellaceae bacterium]